MKTRDSKIVADGADRYRTAKDYRATRARLLAEVTQRYAAEQANASWWRRLSIAVKIRREVAARMNREFPPAASYLLIVDQR